MAKYVFFCEIVTAGFRYLGKLGITFHVVKLSMLGIRTFNSKKFFVFPYYFEFVIKFSLHCFSFFSFFVFFTVFLSLKFSGIIFDNFDQIYYLKKYTVYNRFGESFVWNFYVKFSLFFVKNNDIFQADKKWLFKFHNFDIKLPNFCQICFCVKLLRRDDLG